MTTRAAAKQRRYRERAADRRMVVLVEVDIDGVEALAAIGLLNTQATDDRGAVACAVARLLHMLSVCYR